MICVSRGLTWNTEGWAARVIWVYSCAEAQMAAEKRAQELQAATDARFAAQQRAAEQVTWHGCL